MSDDSNLLSAPILTPYEGGDEAKNGVTLSWKNINYVVEDGLGIWKCKIKKKKKKLLNDLSGMVPQGRVVAIMGPSGSGKTTFLDTLAGRISKQAGLTGEILLNGKKKPSNFKGLSSYVMQDDALIGSLSVFENLLFSALLKLPPTMTYKQKLDRVNEVIDELGLNRVRDVKIGTVLYRGVSGGERRRVSIGVELLKRPKLLFLDEPTSGLDSFSSYNIIELIQTIARNHACTIIMTIHQPSSSILKLFDGLMLLSKGNLVYFGPTLAAADFFDSNGFPCEPFTNPADHYLEIINEDFQVQQESQKELITPGAEEHNAGQPSSTPSGHTVRDLSETFRNSAQYKAILQKIDENQNNAEEYKISKKDYPKYGTNPVMQTILLSARMLIQYMRDPAIYWMRIAMYSFLAIMMGTLYVQIGSDQGAIQDRLSVLFFSIAFLSFMSVSALPAFVEDKIIFARERMNGTYSVLPYTLAQIIVSVPFVCLIAVLFTAISYYIIYLNAGPGHFFIFMGVLALALNVAESMIIAISAISPNFIFGLALGAGSFGAFMLCCGFFLLKKNIPGYWIWLHYLSFEKYGFEALMVNEFKGKSFPCDTHEVVTTPIGGYYPVKVMECNCAYPDLNNDCQLSGDEILSFYEYDNVHIWAWCIVLAGMAVFFRILFYFFLRFFNKGKR